MVPSTTSTHTSAGPSSLIPAPPPLPRPPNAPGPGSSTMSGHPGPVPGGHPSMNVPYGHMGGPHHHHQQQSHPSIGGPNNGPAYSAMPSSSPTGRSMNPTSVPGAPGMHPSHAPHSQHSQHGPSPSHSQFHHQLHSPSAVRQSSHHHQPPGVPSHHQHLHPMHPPQPPPHHPNMPPHHQQHPSQHPSQHQAHQPPHHQQQYQHYQHQQHQQHHQQHQQQQHHHQHPSQHPSQHQPHHRMPQSSNPPPPPPPGSTPSQQQRSQQMYLSNSINGNWQSDKDIGQRREMIQNIVQLLKQRDKNSSQEWLNKLPQMVKQLEVSLYRSAPSFEAYADKNTLKHRLQLLAMEIAKKTHPTGGDEHSSTAAGGDKHKDNASTGGSGGGGGGGNPSSVSRRPPPPQQQQQPPLPLPPQQQPPPRMGGYPPNHNGSGNARPGDILHGVGHRGPMNSPSMRMDQPPPPPMSNSMHTSWNRPRNSDQGTVHSRESSSSNKPSQVVNLGQINNMMSVPGPQPTPTVGSASLGNKNGPGSSGNSKASDKEWEVRIRHKQQRLLLLHHSSKCQNADGKCPVTPHCADMKRLWLHMAKCEDNRCTVPHCYSSRAILSHYRKCKDPECQACGPVRETVWKSRNNTRPKSGGLTPGDNQRMGLNSLMRGPGPPQQPQTLLPTSSSTKPPPLTASVPPPMSSNGSVPPQARKSPLQPSSVSSSSKVSEIDPKIKHKQQRLLLLRHASKCTAKDGECKKTPHCADMKRLWKHISECHDNKCKYPHCLSSRYVLMHYRKCKDALCPACAPVREIANQQQQQPPQLSQQPPPSQNPREKRARTESSGTTPSIEQKEIKPEPKQSPQYSSEEHSYSIMNNFTIEQIQLHLQSLKQTYMLPQKAMKEKCLSIMKTLHDHDHFWVFSKPVDPDELGLPDYFDVIKKPMDLGTVQKKLDSGQYHSISDFNCDIRLTFDNALTYNEPGSVVNDMATQMKQEYEKKYEALLENLQKEETDRMKNDRACALCGFEKLQFEPPVFFCNNLKCPSKRIRRNTHFYSGGNNQYNYCSQCYNDLDADMKLEMPDMTLKKADLKKKKNDEVHEENWVQCDECQRWIHQICGLFNSRQNKDSSCTYSCPKCLLEKRKKGTKPGKADSPTAEQLPRTKLSEWIEDYIEEKVKNQYKVLAKEKSEVEKIPFEQAHQTIKASGKVTIRQVTSTDRKLEVREKMRTHYVHKNYPEEFPYRCKCLLVFQNIDGADVILFALYVYEHGADNPKPNQRTVYISYLDSVHFMRPRRLRTFVYHEILIGYLEYARRSGFAKAHIWACPPLKGDDYIFYAKPEDQKTPKDKMLTKWYIDMLLECQNRSIVGKVTNMYDLYFAPGLFDATAVPYLEGDYFSSEIESIIKEIEEGGKNGTTGKKNKKKKGGDKKSKSKNNRKGTRSGGLDETAVLLAETAVTGSGVIRDPVMVKLGDRIKDMKQSFIVAFLNWDGASPEDKEVPQSILDERQRRKLIKEEPEKGSSKKRDLNGNVKSEAKKNNNIIDDDSEEISAEIFDTRQDFLNLCKGNHYQFDAPRRAKHTSMMVLWHLHNKSAAKFVHVCIHCSKEILTGFRYTCQVCTDVDLCSDCFKKRKDIPNLCKHPLVPKAVEPESSQSGSGSNSNLTEAQRRERKRNINLHIKLLEHASTCPNPKCGSSNCAKMKQYLKHSQVCKEKMSGGCKICKRIWTLLRYHAQSCKNRNCTIPQCRAIRDRIRQIAKQQQAMDDRRRHMINRQYRTGQSSS